MFVGDHGAVLPDPERSTQLSSTALPSNRTAFAFESADFQPVPLLSLSMYGLDQSVDLSP
jgi:hypothetical protein